MRLERVPAPLITRFAPAPTGHLHIGHVVNALHAWGIAREHGGRVLLRIEDHDGQRSRREFEGSILEDLEWLGFTPDEPMVRQSERGEIYERALAPASGAGSSLRLRVLAFLGSAGLQTCLRELRRTLVSGDLPR